MVSEDAQPDGHGSSSLVCGQGLFEPMAHDLRGVEATRVPQELQRHMWSPDPADVSSRACHAGLCRRCERVRAAAGATLHLVWVQSAQQKLVRRQQQQLEAALEVVQQHQQQQGLVPGQVSTVEAQDKVMEGSRQVQLVAAPAHVSSTVVGEQQEPAAGDFIAAVRASPGVQPQAEVPVGLITTAGKPAEQVRSL
ncbi:hypothetical protein ABBQ32_000233 [Trebouxia sp. C0010 RCD-2024]